MNYSYSEILDELELQSINIQNAYYDERKNVFYVLCVGNSEYYDKSETELKNDLVYYEHYTKEESNKIVKTLKKRITKS